jgi:polyphenol oxidase
MTEILTSDNLATLKGITHAYFSRSWGNGGFSGQENPQDVYIARQKMANHLGIANDQLLTGYQIHSPDVVVVEKKWSGEDRPRADALVTNRPGFALGVLTADCVPILFADEVKGVIGAAHAGWRGAIGGVIENTIAAMEKLGSHKDTLCASLGPCIWQNSYEVGPDFPAPFLAEDPDNEHFFKPAFKSGHYQFDLPGYVVGKLKKLGLKTIEGSLADTYADPARFFSHRYSTLRSEQRQGNLMSAIALREK